MLTNLDIIMSLEFAVTLHASSRRGERSFKLLEGNDVCVSFLVSTIGSTLNVCVVLFLSSKIKMFPLLFSSQNKKKTEHQCVTVVEAEYTRRKRRRRGNKTTSWFRTRGCDGKCPDRTPRRRLSCGTPGRTRALRPTCCRRTRRRISACDAKSPKRRSVWA